MAFRIAFFIAAFLLLALLIETHIAIGNAFPTPWSDEAYFLIPAISFYKSLTFDAHRMLNPNGIFWLPAGQYIVEGGIFRIVNFVSLGVARWISFGETMFSAFIFYFILRRSSPASKISNFVSFTISALWVTSVYVLLASNIARPEALTILLSFAAVLASLEKYYWATMGFAILAALSHPLLAFPALTLCLLTLFDLIKRKPNKTEIVVLTIAILLLLNEAFRFLSHTVDYTAHLQFQIARKASRLLRPATATFVVLLILSYGAALIFRRIGRVSQSASFFALFIFGLASITVYYYGQEMWYGVLWTNGLFFCLCALRILAETVTGRKAWLPDLSIATILTLAFLIWSTQWTRSFVLTDSLSGFSVRPAHIILLNRDWEDLVAKIKKQAYLPHSNVLVVPTLYMDLYKYFGYNNTYTFNNLSSRTETNLLYAIRFTKTYPLWLNNEDYLAIPEYLLSGYVCDRVDIVESQFSFFSAKIIKLRKAASEGTFKDCS